MDLLSLNQSVEKVSLRYIENVECKCYPKVSQTVPYCSRRMKKLNPTDFTNALNHSIISPLCQVWVCDCGAGVTGVFSRGSPVLIGPSHMG